VLSNQEFKQKAVYFEYSIKFIEYSLRKNEQRKRSFLHFSFAIAKKEGVFSSIR